MQSFALRGEKKPKFGIHLELRSVQGMKGIWTEKEGRQKGGGRDGEGEEEGEEGYFCKQFDSLSVLDCPEKNFTPSVGRPAFW